MDGTSHSLVPVPREPMALVPNESVIFRVGDEDDDDAEFFALRRLCGILAVLLWIAVRVIRRLRFELIELRLERIGLRQQAHYWQAQHRRAVERETKLEEQIQILQAEIREWKRRTFGRKTETGSATQPQATNTPPTPPKPRRRGQQPRSKGHGRRQHEHLPAREEVCELPEEQRCCPQCRQPFEEIAGTNDGTILEIEVKAHRRVYHRKRYRTCCKCPDQPAVITAPPPDKLFPKGTIGLSIWVLILLRKFAFYQPLHRVLAELRSHQLDLPAGTITDGLMKLEPLFQPLYEGLVEHNRQESHWHGDETRWLVFVKREDKANFCWNLWVFAGKESIVYVLDPTRAHDVPETHFGPDAEGILNVDRYSAYKAMAQVKAGTITLAFCWAHVRRDFLAVLTGWSELSKWAWSWLEEIGQLYHLNDQRLLAREAEAPATPSSEKLPTFAEADRLVREQVKHLQERRDRELSQADLRMPQRKVLTSLQNHWSGLTVFVDRPDIPLDNNEAERRERGPVVARKNFYGSGSLASGRLTAMLFSLIQTLQVWQMDAAKWLTAYLAACAQAKGKPPPEPVRFLPWNMTENERKQMSLTKTNPATPPPTERAAA
jgi:transposase